MTIFATAGSGLRALATPRLPVPRGPLSEVVIRAVAGPPSPIGLPLDPGRGVDLLADHDFQLALYCCYELHYRGFDGVDPDWEWWPPLLTFRRSLEKAFEERVRDEVGPVAAPADVRLAITDVIAGGSGPSLSGYMAEKGSLEEMREFCIHRSAYQLKEADPHTWAIPRITGEAKAAMVEIQADEYGGGVETEMHSTLFADTMEELSLDTNYGAYLDLIPGPTLATVNLVNLLGLHRRLRGALVGHLALFEMTSVTPMGRYSAALKRLGLGARARRFYDVHVVADAVHEVVASERLAAGLVRAEPELAADVVFGAKAVMVIEERFARHLLDAWAQGKTSLLDPRPSEGRRAIDCGQAWD